VKGSGPRAGRASERKWTATSHNRYENQALAEVAIALSETRQLGCVRDHRWRVVYGTDELRLLYGANLELAPLAVGFHLFGPEQVSASLQWRNGPNTIEINRVQFVALGGMVLADTPGGRGQLRELVHPALQDIVDRLSPAQPAAVSFMSSGATVAREIVDVPVLAMRIRDRDGRLVGTAVIAKPAAGMATLAAMAAAGDLPLPADAARRPATRRPTALLVRSRGILTIGATPLDSSVFRARPPPRWCRRPVCDQRRRLSRRRVVALFLAETARSESAAARNCITAARLLQARG
jgi:hypothetical protein